jgi:hypothetical protein
MTTEGGWSVQTDASVSVHVRADAMFQASIMIQLLICDDYDAGPRELRVNQ